MTVADTVVTPIVEARTPRREGDLGAPPSPFRPVPDRSRRRSTPTTPTPSITAVRAGTAPPDRTAAFAPLEALDIGRRGQPQPAEDRRFHRDDRASRRPERVATSSLTRSDDRHPSILRAPDTAHMPGRCSRFPPRDSNGSRDRHFEVHLGRTDRAGRPVRLVRAGGPRHDHAGLRRRAARHALPVGDVGRLRRQALHRLRGRGAHLRRGPRRSCARWPTSSPTPTESARATVSPSPCATTPNGHAPTGRRSRSAPRPSASTPGGPAPSSSTA